MIAAANPGCAILTESKRLPLVWDQLGIALPTWKRLLPETRDPHAARGLDLVGAALAVVGLGASTWALTEGGPRGWSDPAVLGAGVIAIVAVAAFVWRLLHTDDPHDADRLYVGTLGEGVFIFEGKSQKVDLAKRKAAEAVAAAVGGTNK